VCYSEGMEKQKYKNQTFSLPITVSKDLHFLVKARERSHFVADAISEKLEAKKQELRDAYIAMNKDPGQIEAMKEWENTVADGIDEW
jgi:metal-responsive CopG/Arc/MetJ family transcriptional regulator